MKYICCLILCVFPVIAFCQKAHSFDKAIEKITGKTWIITQECINDSCISITNDDYYYFSKGYYNYGKSSDTVYIQYNHFIIRKFDNPPVEPRFSLVSCNPAWFFYESLHNDDTIYQVQIRGENNNETGEITIISDDQLSLLSNYTKHRLYGDNKVKRYYNLIKTPEEILNAMK